MKKNEKCGKYCIGLDIGTASIGWCVTDENSNILKRKQKLLRGIRTFDEAQPASTRRSFRSARRRKLRKKQRINLLQEIMAEDVLSVDETFYHKLSETGKWLEDRNDKSYKFNLFKEIEFNDQHYYKKYPTIYHLRNYLVNTNEKVDIRLVYLAIHHIIKYRGNFLYEGQHIENGSNNIENSIESIIEFLEDLGIRLKNEKGCLQISRILLDNNMRRDDKIKKINELFIDNKSKVLDNVIKLILGKEVDLDEIFDIGKESKINLSKDEETVISDLGEKQIYLQSMKIIYSNIVLADILNGIDYISEAFIDKYNKYGEDLALLKKVYKNYLPEKYNFMFRKEGENKKTYYTYNKRNVYSGKRHKCANAKKEVCTYDDLLKTIEADIEKLDNEETNEIKQKILYDKFLEKLNTVNNGSIPYQLHLSELDKILDNQSKYYNTLKDNKDKIRKLLTFRIPYYVGPLSRNKTEFAWMVRKEEGKIYPWNFEEKVDLNESAEKFIRRMTNKCTYLRDKDVIPKNSLLYSKYCVLNEINNIRISDEKNNIRNKKIGVDIKKSIIEDVFKTQKKVTLKKLKEYLINNQLYSSDVIITGLSKETEFISTLTSYNDFKRIFGKIDENNENMVEEIIYWRTIFETSDILKQKIESKYPEITQEQIKEICKLKYSGWSRLSKELLKDIKSHDNESIMDLLEKTQMNFMQIINDKKIGIAQKIEKYSENNKQGENIKELVEDLQGSQALKRAIWQSYLIVAEIVKVMGCEPYNIYIEMAKGDEEKVRTVSRYEKLKMLYKTITNDNDEYSAIYEELKKLSTEDSKDLKEKMYLYFLQNGKCLYSMKTLSLEQISETCEVDHILPRCFGDDGLDNKALVLKEYNQKKTDELVIEESIRRNCAQWWMQLMKYGLMTRKKYDALTKNSITAIEKEKFINRQLVETRQITKNVVNILSNKFANSKIYSLKARLVTQFREKYNIVKNRDVNLFHHADDAYILSVIGNYIEKTFPKEQNEFLYAEYIHRFSKIDKNKILDMQHGAIIENFNIDTDTWDHAIELKKVKDNIKKRDYLITKKLEENTGEFYNQTIYGKNDTGKDKAKIELKKGLDVNKYGYKTSNKDAYMCIVKYKEKNKETKELIGVPITIAMAMKSKSTKSEKYNILKEYISNYLKVKEFVILKEKILKYQLIEKENGHLYRLASKKELNNAKQLILPSTVVEFLTICSNENHTDYMKNISNEETMNKIYELLLEKIKKEYLDYGTEYNNLFNGFEEFKKLEAKEKINALNEIITILGKKCGPVSFINRGEQGRKKLKRKLDTITIIDQSVTGIYERRYKIDELENCDSN